MDIQQQKQDGVLVIALAGRFDATWSAAVESALTSAIRSGEHQIHLEMSQVRYISSAALRVLVATHRQIQSINGRFAVCEASTEVLQVLDLSGLRKMLVTEAPSKVAGVEAKTFQSAHASWEVFEEEQATPAVLGGIGSPSVWKRAENGRSLEFPAGLLGIGVAAFGNSREEAAPHLGEFLAVSGCAAYLPAGESNRPDFVVSQQDLVPVAWMESGIAGKVSFSRLLRFEAACEARTIAWEEIAGVGLEQSGAPAVVLVAVTETAGLIGASLRKSPAEAHSPEEPMDFPAIREWLNFTSERAFRDSTSVIVGVAAREGSGWSEWLRPLGTGGDIHGHFHACAFPYRPIRKGRIPLDETIVALFEAEGLQSVLHLVADIREIDGAGQSEFYRGAVWLAPLSDKP